MKSLLHLFHRGGELLPKNKKAGTPNLDGIPGFPFPAFPIPNSVASQLPNFAASILPPWSLFSSFLPNSAFRNPNSNCLDPLSFYFTIQINSFNLINQSTLLLLAFCLLPFRFSTLTLCPSIHTPITVKSLMSTT